MHSWHYICSVTSEHDCPTIGLEGKTEGKATTVLKIELSVAATRLFEWIWLSTELSSNYYNFTHLKSSKIDGFSVHMSLGVP